MNRPSGIPTTVTSRITDPIGRRKNSLAPQPIDAPSGLHGGVTFPSSRGANASRSKPRISEDTVADPPRESAREPDDVDVEPGHDVHPVARTVAPSSTVGVEFVTRSPPTSAPDLITRSPFNILTNGAGDLGVPVENHERLLDLAGDRGDPSKISAVYDLALGDHQLPGEDDLVLGVALSAPSCADAAEDQSPTIVRRRRMGTRRRILPTVPMPTSYRKPTARQRIAVYGTTDPSETGPTTLLPRPPLGHRARERKEA